MRGDENKNIILVNLIGVLTFSLFLILFVTNVSAAPAVPIVVTLTQPNGIKFDAVAWGDEWLNGMETVEGYTIILNELTDTWVYAEPSTDKDLSTQTRGQTQLIVGVDNPADLPKHYRPEEIIGFSRGSSLESPSRSEGSTALNAGPQPVLVLLVEFRNYPGRTTVEEWSQKIFGPTNSVGHYYHDASFGKLTLVPGAESKGITNDGIVGWLTLESNHPDLGGQLSAGNLDITRNAILAANEFVNFKAFDSNDDGYLSYDELHIMVVVAGHESAYGGAQSCTPNVWAHHYYLDYIFVNAPIVDGVRVASYAGGGGYTQFGEIHCEPENAPGHTATIGIIAHELGHDLQWPDLYDTFNQYSFEEMDTQGIGNWGLMGTGMWNRSTPTSPYYGDSPAYPTAWSRWYQGWLSPIHITKSSLNVNIPPVATSSIVYQLRDNPNGVDWVWGQRSGVGEYFLVENRPLIGYDVGLPGPGLLIWHIDESVIFNNYANSDQNHRLVDLIQADGLRDLNLTMDNRGDPGDPFPGTSLNTVFNANSIPSSNLYFGIPSGVSVTSIEIDNSAIIANLFVTSFEDVLADDWAWSSVEALTASGITTGTDENHFSPLKGTSRAEMAVFLGRAIYGTENPPDQGVGEHDGGEENEPIEPIFEDVGLDHWAVGWIEQLYRDGLTKGCNQEGNLFCPDQLVTRDQMAVFLSRYLFGVNDNLIGYQGIFADINEGHWAAKEIEQLYIAGITKGCINSPELLYCPEKTISRAEMAAFIQRAFAFAAP
jgi:M6 family metalloprotease-like protein